MARPGSAVSPRQAKTALRAARKTAQIVGAVSSLISSVLLPACCFALSLLASVLFSCCRCFHRTAQPVDFTPRVVCVQPASAPCPRPAPAGVVSGAAQPCAGMTETGRHAPPPTTQAATARGRTSPPPPRPPTTTRSVTTDPNRRGVPGPVFPVRLRPGGRGPWEDLVYSSSAAAATQAGGGPRPGGRFLRQTSSPRSAARARRAPRGVRRLSVATRREGQGCQRYSLVASDRANAVGTAHGGGGNALLVPSPASLRHATTPYAECDPKGDARHFRAH